MQKVNIIGYISITVLTSLTFFGAYQFYFKKPTPQVIYASGNNTISAPDKDDRRIQPFIGIYGGRGSIGVVAGVTF